jgi:hypothetical protein
VFGRFPAQSHLGPVDAEYPRIAAGGASGGSYAAARQKPELHQPPGYIVGQIQVLENAMFALMKLHQTGGRAAVAAMPSPPPVLETQLHQMLSMKRADSVVKQAGKGREVIDIQLICI